MRPTSEESLQGMRRVLADVIMPTVNDSYAIEQIGHQIAALDDLARHCRDDIPRLMQANDDMLVLIDEARRLVDEQDTLATELDKGAAIARSLHPRYPDFEDLNERNIVLRGLLSSIIQAWPSRPGLSQQRSELRGRIRCHLESQIVRSS
jgi:hypothetical protein